jgi:threonine dehydratase
MDGSPSTRVGRADVEAAATRLRGRILRTPLIAAPQFPGFPKDGLFLKLESLQRTGSFKIRGATNRILQLSDAAAQRGVVAASAGNHAQGVAAAAQSRGIPATIVMARTASPLKVRSTRELGARVILHGADYEEAHQEAVRIAEAEGATYVHPFDDASVIAGQGTVGLEILEELPMVRRIIVGVGGGGLVAGIAAAVQEARPSVEVVGVQPMGSDTLGASLRQGRVVLGGPPKTWADGLATRHLGDLPFRLIRELGVQARSVDDRTIARAAFLLLERARIVAEGAGATPLAALLAHPELLDGVPTVLVISGGNLDPFLLDRILFIGLSAEGRVLRIRTPVTDAPGRLSEFLRIGAEARANVRHIRHDRDSPDRLPGEVEVEIEFEVRDAAHGEELLTAYRDRGWPVERTGVASPEAPPSDRSIKP